MNTSYLLVAVHQALTHGQSILSGVRLQGVYGFCGGVNINYSIKVERLE
jgi:hypothetical protein